MSRTCIDFKRDYGALTEILNPLEFSGCALWLDSKDEGTIIKNALDEVSQWNDKSGNNNHFVTLQTNNPPRFITNGIANSNSIEFQGGEKMEATNPFRVFDGVAFFALRAEDLGPNSVFFDDGTYSLRYEQWNNTGLMGYTHYGVADYRSSILTNYAVDDLAVFKKENGTSFIEVQNNVASGQQINTGGNKPIPIGVLGGRGTSTTIDAFKGFIAEAIVYDRPLTTQESFLVQKYLKNRWGF